MTQYNINLNPATDGGAALDAALDSWRDALHTNHSGAARPAYAVAGMTWIKPVSGTAHELYYFDGADDILLATFDATNNRTNLTTLYNILSNAGNALINPAAPVDGLAWDRAGNGLVLSRSAGPSLLVVRHGSDGQIAQWYRNGAQVGGISVTTTATTYVTSSDYRLKYDISNIGFTFGPDEDISGPLGKLMRLKPSKYHMTGDDGAEWHYGFIAHELQAEIPEAVTGSKDATEWQEVVVGYHDDPNGGDPIPVTERRETPVYQGVDTGQVVALLVASVQQLTRRVMELEVLIQQPANPPDTSGAYYCERN